MSIDTFSSAMWTSAHTGEKGHDMIVHWKMAFAILGMPSSVKTEKGPAYVSQKMHQFLRLWGVSHKLGIQHSPIGQGIVEHAHGTLKCVLEKQKRERNLGETCAWRNLAQPAGQSSKANQSSYSATKFKQSCHFKSLFHVAVFK